MKIAYKRSDGAVLIEDETDENGVVWGHVKMPDGTEFESHRMLSIVAHGYWEVADGQ